jgi:hypothetical protein
VEYKSYNAKKATSKEMALDPAYTKSIDVRGSIPI